MPKNIKVLVVDDNSLNVSIVQGILEDDYILDFAFNGKEAISKFGLFKPDILLLDIMMPDMDGFEVLANICNLDHYPRSKIILVSALTTLDSRLRGYEMGAHDYIIKPFDDEELKAKIDIFSELTHTRELKEAFSYTIGALARAAEVSDEDTGEHIIRVNEYSYLLAKKYGCDDYFCQQIRCFAQMHDVGKIHIPTEILNKTTRLTNDEFIVIKGHPIHGAKIIGDSDNLKMAREIALSHHEKWDGSGYPMGLAGEDIPLSGRIVALADVYDALRSERAYKPAFSHAKTRSIFKDGDDRLDPSKHFDPKLLDIFISCDSEFEQIYDSINEKKLI